MLFRSLPHNRTVLHYPRLRGGRGETTQVGCLTAGPAGREAPAECCGPLFVPGAEFVARDPALLGPNRRAAAVGRFERPRRRPEFSSFGAGRSRALGLLAALVCAHEHAEAGIFARSEALMTVGL